MSVKAQCRESWKRKNCRAGRFPVPRSWKTGRNKGKKKPIDFSSLTTVRTNCCRYLMCALYLKGSKLSNIYYLTNTKTKLINEPVYLPPKEKIVVWIHSEMPGRLEGLNLQLGKERLRISLWSCGATWIPRKPSGIELKPVRTIENWKLIKTFRAFKNNPFKWSYRLTGKDGSPSSYKFGFESR